MVWRPHLHPHLHLQRLVWHLGHRFRRWRVDAPPVPEGGFATRNRDDLMFYRATVEIHGLHLDRGEGEPPILGLFCTVLVTSLTPSV